MHNKLKARRFLPSETTTRKKKKEERTKATTEMNVKKKNTDSLELHLRRGNTNRKWNHDEEGDETGEAEIPASS